METLARFGVIVAAVLFLSTSGSPAHTGVFLLKVVRSFIVSCKLGYPFESFLIQGLKIQQAHPRPLFFSALRCVIKKLI